MIRNRSRLTNLTAQDTVVVYPSIGRLTQDGRFWRIDVRGTVYESGSVSRRKHLLLRLLQRVARVQPSEAERDLFESRIRAFIAPTGRGRRIAVRFGNHVYPIQRATRRNGRFAGTVRLAVQDVERLRLEGDLADGWLNVRVVAPGGDDSRCSGQACLLKADGVSVVSDIDDTIKHSEVHSRRRLLANTFLRKFQPIEGMAELYRHWELQGAEFHYVSSSPWQLFAPLSELLGDSGFPSGSFHLRSFQLREHMLRRLKLIRRSGKYVVIRQLLRTFPHRRFVLVGDSGEKDPELYGALARKYVGQVQAILIRELPQRRMDFERRSKAFARLKSDRCHVFRDSSELPDNLLRRPSAGQSDLAEIGNCRPGSRTAPIHSGRPRPR